MKVSVVVPIWNSRKYLADCIRYLKAQTFQDFEVIFVVDSKTDDGSEEEIRSAEGLDIKIYTQNDDGRVSSARNIGQAASSGEFVWFLDVDDTPSPLFLEEMLRLIGETGADFVASNFIYQHHGKRLPRIRKEFHVREYSGIDAILAMNKGIISPNVWDKLFRTSLIRDNGILFEMGYSEDYHFVSEACVHSSKVAYTSRPLYLYNLNENSRSSSKGNDIATKDVEIFEKYKSVVQEERPDYYPLFCRMSMRHLIRSMTMADWKTCKSLIGRESIRSSKAYCNLTNIEFLVFRTSPRIYYVIGRNVRFHRYKSKSFISNPHL